ncbi:MAG: hypothetical protein R3E50_05155 [Halioglobus sp.]
MKIQRMLVIKIHAFLACFFIPMATLYFVSGALYTFDVKGSIDKQVFTLALDRPFAPDLAQLSDVATTALRQRDLALPSGDPSISKKKGAYVYRWGDLKYLVELKPGKDPLAVELTYRQRSPLAQVMRVHRAEAGSLIKGLSLSMAVALLTILATGVYLAVGLPKLRRPALLALGAGVIALLPVFL